MNFQPGRRKYKCAFSEYCENYREICRRKLVYAAHLSEYCPGVGGHEAGDPDEPDHLPGAAHTCPRVQGQRVADGLVPATHSTVSTDSTDSIDNI